MGQRALRGDPGGGLSDRAAPGRVPDALGGRGGGRELRLRRGLVGALAVGCRALDAVTHRPAAMRLVPGVRRCRLARRSQRLDERWGTGLWPEDAPHPVPLLPCSACFRRPAVRAVSAPEGWLRRHPVELCEWCELPTTAFDGAEDLARALAAARRATT